MKILGMEKLSLVDYDDHISSTIFTGGCNFRCPYCHNAPLVINPDGQGTMEEEEIFAYLKKRKGILQGVCITGGEPTLAKGLKDFILKVKELGYDVKLDSNGTHPEILRDFIEEKIVDYIAMDIKNSKSRYGETVDKKNFDLSPVEESVFLLKENIVPYEFRTTLVKEFISEKDMEDIAEWLKGAEKYFLQHFKDSGNCIRNDLHEVEEATAERYKEIAAKKIKYVALRGY